jgi:hypothetical protein
MDQPYSPVADWLSKFHTASEPIQALWIVALAILGLALAATILGLARTLTAPLRLWLATRRERGEPRGELVYGVYRDAQGRWLLYAPGAVRVLGEGGAAGGEDGRVTILSVIPGLEPGIHAFARGKAWMAGTSPAMTGRGRGARAPLVRLVIPGLVPGDPRLWSALRGVRRGWPGRDRP